MRTKLSLAVLAAATWICLGTAVVSPALAQGNSPRSDDEIELESVEGDVLSLQRELSAARKRGDDPEKVKDLQKKFDKLQKKRVGLLRKTWQM